MREVGVRELKASLSELLRLVAHGGRVRVTVRGRAVADLVPPGAGTVDDPLESLAAAGRLAAPTRPRPARPPRLARGSRSASEVVMSERDAER